MYALALASSAPLNTTADLLAQYVNPSTTTYFYVFVCFLYIAFDFLWYHHAALELKAATESEPEALTESEPEALTESEPEVLTESEPEVLTESEPEAPIQPAPTVTSHLYIALELLTVKQLNRITTKADLNEIVFAKNKQRYIYAATRTIVRKILARGIQPEDTLDALASMTVPLTAVNALREHEAAVLAELQFLMSFRSVGPSSASGTQ